MTHHATPPAPRKQKRAKPVTGTLQCCEVIPGSTSLSIRNDVGGSAYLPPGRYRIRLLRTTYDYETGWRCTGDLLDHAQIEIARNVGTTGFTPDDYGKYGLERVAAVFDAAQQFNPARVYFHLDDFTPDAHGNAA
jgi:hypothetical protein